MELEFEEYYTQCGEMFLTVKGNIVFHCVVCENISKTFKDYAFHTKKHYKEFLKEEQLIHTEDRGSLLLDVQTLEETENNENSYDEPDVADVMESTVIDSPLVKNEAEPEESVDILMLRLDVKINTKLRNSVLRACDKRRKYKCIYCEYACPDKSNLKSHIKRHSIEKQHKCPECCKGFHTRTELEVHLRSHTGEKPYLCTECGASFKTSSRLSLHEKRHANIRDKKCTTCNYSCFDMSALRLHLATHSSDRKYKCPQCQASFKAKVALRNHIRIHENKKEYACKLCTFKFNQLAGLHSHMKSSHAVAV